MVIISDVLLSTTLNEPGNQASESIVSPSGELDSATVDNPIDIIVPEHQPPAGTVLENDPSPHLHIDDGAASKTSNGSGAAARDNTTSHRATTNTAVVSRVAQPADLHAFLVLRDVPRDAEVYLLGVKMTARGELRRYRIPLLASDVQYDYQVELRLPVDGDRSAEVVTQVSAGVTTELWVARAGNRLVLQDQQNVQSESLPLAVN